MMSPFLLYPHGLFELCDSPLVVVGTFSKTADVLLKYLVALPIPPFVSNWFCTFENVVQSHGSPQKFISVESDRDRPAKRPFARLADDDFAFGGVCCGVKDIVAMQIQHYVQ